MRKLSATKKIGKILSVVRTGTEPRPKEKKTH